MRPWTGANLIGWLAGGLLLTIGSPVIAAETPKVELTPGDPVPVFQAVDDQGQPWKSAERLGQTYVVIYFYPGDFTPGCIRQALSFRDNMNKLADRGVEVVGISGDTVANHQLFKKAYHLNFTLLADENGSVAQAFGVPVGAGGPVKAVDPQTRKPLAGEDGKAIELRRNVTASRWTFVIDKRGKVAFKNTSVSPEHDSKQVAEVIDRLEK
jgi:thioredoxin-dependent peroxiredoxin